MVMRVLLWMLHGECCRAGVRCAKRRQRAHKRLRASLPAAPLDCHTASPAHLCLHAGAMESARHAMADLANFTSRAWAEGRVPEVDDHIARAMVRRRRRRGVQTAERARW